jgi:hypothetical protein
MWRQRGALAQAGQEAGLSIFTGGVLLELHRGQDGEVAQANRVEKGEAVL